MTHCLVLGYTGLTGYYFSCLKQYIVVATYILDDDIGGSTKSRRGEIE